MTQKPSPTGLAILICDQIIEDKVTNKKSIIGIFNNINGSNFPCRHPQMAVFVSLTDGQGGYNAELRIANEETTQTIGELSGQIQFPDRHHVVELNFNLVGLVFPQPGLYSIEFYCDDALILERRFHVTQAKPTTPPPKGPPPEEL